MEGSATGPYIQPEMHIMGFGDKSEKNNLRKWYAVVLHGTVVLWRFSRKCKGDAYDGALHSG